MHPFAQALPSPRRLLFTVLLCSLFVNTPVLVNAHPHAILACGVIKTAAPMSPPEILENGLVAERYDTNGDKKVDVVTLSAPLGNGNASEHQKEPLFYIVDFDKDGEPDAIFVDKNGVGKCEDIALYQDLKTPLGVAPGRSPVESGKEL